MEVPLSARARQRTLIGLYLFAGLALAIGLWVQGASFYTTHPWDRASHPDYEFLRSSGPWGLGLGIAGTFLILLNLTFLLRRRVRSFRRFGALRIWMDMHVVTGLLGPLLIVYHTTFHLRTTVATAAVIALAVLVATGLIGRFIYAMVPHTVAGVEMGRAELERHLEGRRAHLHATVADDDPVWARLDQLSRSSVKVPTTKIGCLILLPWFGLESLLLRLQLRSLGHALVARASHTPADATEMLHDVREIVLTRKRLHVLAVYRELLRWWRALHRVFAVVMVAMAVLHVGVVLYLGYGPTAGGG
ncbi:MAG: hypothetical protein H6746_01890 [Deltaproteobacteria bacterium]|nr:hypothetical protein [Deltaproteobacteria bacterium]